MALLLPNSCFVHIPKTGGSSVRVTLQQDRLAMGETGDESIRPFQYRAHMTADHAREYTRKPIFCFIRNKTDWYLSAFRHRLDTGQWPMLDETDQTMRYQGQAFSDWIRVLIDARPHYLERYYSMYTKGASYIGWTETLEADLTEFLLDLEGYRLNIKMPHENTDQGPEIEMDSDTAGLILERG